MMFRATQIYLLTFPYNSTILIIFTIGQVASLCISSQGLQSRRKSSTKLVDSSGFGGLCSRGGPLFCHFSFPLFWNQTAWFLSMATNIFGWSSFWLISRVLMTWVDSLVVSWETSFSSTVPLDSWGFDGPFLKLGIFDFLIHFYPF